MNMTAKEIKRRIAKVLGAYPAITSDTPLWLVDIIDQLIERLERVNKEAKGRICYTQHFHGYHEDHIRQELACGVCGYCKIKDALADLLPPEEGK